MKHFDIDFLTPGVISLEHLNEQIANESGFVSRIANTIMDVIPNLVHAARKTFADTKIDKYDLRFLDVNIVVLKRALGDDTFVNISSLPANVPPGFIDNMYALMLVVEESVKHANEIVQRLTAYNQFLAGVISSTDSRNALRDYSGVMKKLDTERNYIVSKHGSMFKSNSVVALRDYGTVVDNNSQWLSIHEKIKDVIDDAKNHKVALVEKLVAETLQLLDGIEERVRNKTLSDMSPETLRSLSAMTLTAAREVEFYALTMYRLSEYKLCYEKTSETLIKALR